MKKQSIIRSVLAAELVLVPLIVMMFSDEVNWGVGDFIIIGVLLAGVGVADHLIVTGVKSNSHQVVIGIILAAAMLLIWVELAVGVFGSPFAGS